jgi:hypothetical protein
MLLMLPLILLMDPGPHMDVTVRVRLVFTGKTFTSVGLHWTLLALRYILKVFSHHLLPFRALCSSSCLTVCLLFQLPVPNTESLLCCSQLVRYDVAHCWFPGRCAEFTPMEGVSVTLGILFSLLLPLRRRH